MVLGPWQSEYGFRSYREQFQLSQDYKDQWLMLIYILDNNYKTLHLIVAAKDVFKMREATLRQLYAIQKELTIRPLIIPIDICAKESLGSGQFSPRSIQATPGAQEREVRPTTIEPAPRGTAVARSRPYPAMGLGFNVGGSRCVIASCFSRQMLTFIIARLSSSCWFRELPQQLFSSVTPKPKPLRNLVPPSRSRSAEPAEVRKVAVAKKRSTSEMLDGAEQDEVENESPSPSPFKNTSTRLKGRRAAAAVRDEEESSKGESSDQEEAGDEVGIDQGNSNHILSISGVPFEMSSFITPTDRAAMISERICPRRIGCRSS